MHTLKSAHSAIAKELCASVCVLSTWMDDRLGTAGIVGFYFYFLKRNHDLIQRDAYIHVLSPTTIPR